jgi:predicted nucleotidyltransferase
MEHLEEYFPEISAEMLTQICRSYHIRSLSLFGSRLHRDETDNSDIDLLVEFDKDHIPGFSFIRLQEELGTLFGCTVDLHTPMSLSPYFRDTVVCEATRMYAATSGLLDDRAPFIRIA